MSRAYDGHRPFLHFDNPLRKFLPGGSHISRKFLELLNNFEDSLANRLHNLKPVDKSDVLSISWMKQAIGSISETHIEIKSLITNLQFSASEWDERSMDSYLNDSVKLLEVCNSLSSEVSRLNQGQLLLQYALHLLDLSSGGPSHEKFARARDSIVDWMQQVGCSKGLSSCSPRSIKLEQCVHTLHDLERTLYESKIKTSARGKVLLRAMYGVKVQTIFVCSVLVAAFSRSAKSLIELEVPEKFAWFVTFRDLQKDVNGEIKRLFWGSSIIIVKELEAIDCSAVELLAMTEKYRLSFSSDDAGTLMVCVKGLKDKVETLAQGLDLLSKEVNGFFQIVLSRRDALLCGLRLSTGTATSLRLGRNNLKHDSCERERERERERESLMCSFYVELFGVLNVLFHSGYQ